MELHSINPDYYGGCYILKSGPGYSCYGFDVLDRKARAVAGWIETEAAPGDELRDARRMIDAIGARAPGTAEHFAACAAAMDAGGKFAAATGKRCGAELVPALVGMEGRRVEATVFGERVRFNVGKSTGWLPVHLRIHNRRSSGGMALSPDDVRDVRVIR